MAQLGKVFLVGAGPGDPKLITLKGVECLRAADVIIYDRLVNERLFAHARSDAEFVYVGKAPGAHSRSQAEINAILISKARENKVVVRLKGGDPCIFGRGGDEALALQEEGIPFEFVPGVSSAYAVPAYAGIPVTKRGMTKSVTFITGHEEAESDGGINWEALAKMEGTIVFLMAFRNLEHIIQELVDHGMDPATPAAVISRGTLSDQATVVGSLGDIVGKVRAGNLTSPAVTVIGEIVRLRDKLAWFDM